MDHKKALDVLMQLQKNASLSEQEKEAIVTAIGLLSWSMLAKNRIKGLKAKREKDVEW